MKQFDPYRELLKMPDGPRPPGARELLGLGPGELTAQAIRESAANRTDRVRRYATSPSAEIAAHATRLLNEIAAATVSLLAEQPADSQPAENVEGISLTETSQPESADEADVAAAPASNSPYHFILGLPAAAQPPDDRRLLGLPEGALTHAQLDRALKDRCVATMYFLLSPNPETVVTAEKLLEEYLAATARLRWEVLKSRRISRRVARGIKTAAAGLGKGVFLVLYTTLAGILATPRTLWRLVPGPSTVKRALTAPFRAVDYLLGLLAGEGNTILHWFLRIVVSICVLLGVLWSLR